MLVANYKTKKSLKGNKGNSLKYTETSIFGGQYKPNGILTVVGPTAYNRKWWAQITMENDIIVKVT